MVMIPELKTAFCGCSVRTGSKVVGWVNMVLGILEFIIVSAVMGILIFTVSAVDDRNFGKGAIELIQKSNDPEFGVSEDSKSLIHSILPLLVGDVDESDPETVGRLLKDQLKDIFLVIYIIILVIFLFHTLFTTLLLVGVYKNKSGFVLFYLVLSVVSLFGYIPALFSSYLPIDIKISTFAGCLIHFYFTWIIYSFYKELRSPKNYPLQSMAVLVPGGQKHLGDDDVPILVPTGIPNDYYYPQK